MACEQERDRLLQLDRDSLAWYEAWLDLVNCLDEWEGIQIEEEERTWADIQRSLPPLDVVEPWPQPCDKRSEEVRGQIFGDPKKAMVFSEALAKAFEQTGIQLKDDETFACLVCVVPRSRYMSEVLGPDFLGARPIKATLAYIGPPKEMSIIFKAIPELPK